MKRIVTLLTALLIMGMTTLTAFAGTDFAIISGVKTQGLYYVVGGKDNYLTFTVNIPQGYEVSEVRLGGKSIGFQYVGNKIKINLSDAPHFGTVPLEVSLSDGNNLLKDSVYIRLKQTEYAENIDSIDFNGSTTQDIKSRWRSVSTGPTVTAVNRGDANAEAMNIKFITGSTLINLDAPYYNRPAGIYEISFDAKVKPSIKGNPFINLAVRYAEPVGDDYKYVLVVDNNNSTSLPLLMSTGKFYQSGVEYAKNEWVNVKCIINTYNKSWSAYYNHEYMASGRYADTFNSFCSFRITTSGPEDSEVELDNVRVFALTEGGGVVSPAESGVYRTSVPLKVINRKAVSTEFFINGVRVADFGKASDGVYTYILSSQDIRLGHNTFEAKFVYENNYVDYSKRNFYYVENRPIVTIFDDGGKLSPTNAVANVRPGNNTSDIGVVNWESLGRTGETGDTALALSRTEKGSGAPVYFNPRLPNATYTGRIAFEADIKITEALNMYLELGVNVNSTTETSINDPGYKTLHPSIGGKGVSAPLFGEDFSIAGTVIKYTLNTWMHMKYIYDIDKNMFEFYIDGNQIAYALNETGINGKCLVSKFRLNIDSYTGAFVIDNVKMYNEVVSPEIARSVYTKGGSTAQTLYCLIPEGADSLQLTFSRALPAPDGNIEVLVDNQEVQGASVQYDAGNYTITVQGINNIGKNKKLQIKINSSAFGFQAGKDFYAEYLIGDADKLFVEKINVYTVNDNSVVSLVKYVNGGDTREANLITASYDDGMLVGVHFQDVLMDPNFGSLCSINSIQGETIKAMLWNELTPLAQVGQVGRQ